MTDPVKLSNIDRKMQNVIVDMDVDILEKIRKDSITDKSLNKKTKKNKSIMSKLKFWK